MATAIAKANELLLQSEGLSIRAARLYASSGDPAYLRMQADAEARQKDIQTKLKEGFYDPPKPLKRIRKGLINA